MLPDKQIKKEFKKEASLDPDSFYPTKVLKKEGFLRKQCSCGTYFWTVNKDQTICGDPACLGGTQVTKNNPVKNSLTYIQVWKKIVEILEPRGYKPIKRYPVAARWNPTVDFTIASIAAFQPYVVAGDVKAPAKKLIIPQLCLRFGDIDNVGITGSHMTCFVMIGQHQFVTEEEWNQEQAFQDIYDFLIDGVGLPKNEVTIHEDAWAGGGNFGPCMEFFSRGVELFNQVYMTFEQTSEGRIPLKIKVLDMGLGMERIAWFSQGKENIYEATFPNTLKKLKEITKVKMNHELYSKFSQYSALLNADEVENMDEAWKKVGEKINIPAEELKEKISPMTALYSIAEHARTLLVAITDTSLPSNVGGGYNLRLIFRRAMRFIDKFNWNVDMGEVAMWHAEELKELFPELIQNIDSVKKVLEVEKEKYYEMKQRSEQIVKRIIKHEVTTEKLIDLYDSQGINPDIVKEEAKKLGKKIIIPDNFYALVAERHEQKEQDTATKKEKHIDVGTVPDTKVLYFNEYIPTEFTATVLSIINNKYVILDRTQFYPTSGGQLNDQGDINGDDVINVFKQGKIILHDLEKITFKVGDLVRCHVEPERRKQLAIHHTATHIVNAAAKKVLGKHINQAGARKTLEKATLDLTHYQNISKKEMKNIENEANKIVSDAIPIEKKFMSRVDAEKKYGMRIYQGGAVPGKELRIVDIKNVDIEACGGTHLNNTSEAELIHIIKSTKIQDGIIRLTFAAGKRAKELKKESSGNLEEIAKFLSVEEKLIPGRAEELFKKWKMAKKAVKKNKEIDLKELELNSTEVFEGDILEETAIRLKTQKEHIPATLNRFIKELNEMKEKLK